MEMWIWPIILYVSIKIAVFHHVLLCDILGIKERTRSSKFLYKAAKKDQSV